MHGARCHTHTLSLSLSLSVLHIHSPCVSQARVPHLMQCYDLVCFSSSSLGEMNESSATLCCDTSC